jgi:hypothetical protein
MTSDEEIMANIRRHIGDILANDKRHHVHVGRLCLRIVIDPKQPAGFFQRVPGVGLMADSAETVDKAIERWRKHVIWASPPIWIDDDGKIGDAPKEFDTLIEMYAEANRDAEFLGLPQRGGALS